MIDDQIKAVLVDHPNLTYDNDQHVITGLIEANTNDRYEIEIYLEGFPDRFPYTREIGERIPRKADRHIYSDSGFFCFTTPAKEEILLKKKVKSLSTFFNLVLIPFLQNNSYFEINKKYFHGDYSHGIIGVIECYQDILDIADLRLIAQIMLERIRGKKIRPNDPCYCGSGKKIKKCMLHQEKYGDFKLISRHRLETDLTGIYNSIKR